MYTDLPQQEAASVTAWLKEQGVSYELKNDGRSIYVAAGDVYETRLNLAGAGLPRQGGVGFEIFDKQSFGVTKFTQKINYQRALQGELARTIAALEAVKSARVHLVMPEESLLESRRKETKASVVVELAPGHDLGAGQTQGIIHLVAGSIEGLKKDQVNLIDTNGRTLNQQSGEDASLVLLPDKLKFKTTLENRLEANAQSLLNRALGAGNSVVRVTAQLDFTQEAITSEEYDPDSLVPRSEQVTESASGRRESGGVPGVASNLGDGSASGQSIPSSKSSEVTNYEISKTVKQIKSPVGKIENISVAVLVSEVLQSGTAAEEGSPPALSAEKLASIERMVTSAIGLNPERGDRIEVVSMPFQKTMLEGGAVESVPRMYEYLPYVKYVVLLLCAVLLYWVLIRPLMKTLRGETVQYNKTVSEVELELGQDRKALDPPARLREELAQNSVTPTQVIRTWLKEGQAG